MDEHRKQGLTKFTDVSSEENKSRQMSTTEIFIYRRNDALIVCMEKKLYTTARFTVETEFNNNTYTTEFCLLISIRDEQIKKSSAHESHEK